MGVHIKLILITFGAIALQRIECQSQLHSRLRRSVGGRMASIENYPYMASIRSAGKHICGGTIISKDIILTAGTCIPLDVNLDSLYVKVGDADINFEGSWYPVAQVLVHEQYNRSADDQASAEPYRNNLALLKLQESIELNNKTTKIIELFGEKDEVQDYDRGFSAGWGYMPRIVDDPKSKNDPSKPEKQKVYQYSTKLRDVELTIGSVATCSSILPQLDPALSFCTYTLGKVMCYGDNGGPLVIDGRQAGIAYPPLYNICDASGTVTYFVNLSKYRGWIDKHVNELSELKSRA